MTFDSDVSCNYLDHRLRGVPVVREAVFSDFDDIELEKIASRMPMSVLVQMVREAARHQNVRTIDALLNQGAFEFKPSDDENSANDILFANREIPIVAAIANVIGGATHTQILEGDEWRHDDAGMLGKTLYVSDAFRERYDRVVEQFCSSFHSWMKISIDGVDRGAYETQFVSEQADRYGDTLCVLLAGAFAIDSETSARRILEDRRLPDTYPLNTKILGDGNNKAVMRKNQAHWLWFSPMAMLVEFDAPRARAVFEELQPQWRGNIARLQPVHNGGTGSIERALTLIDDGVLRVHPNVMSRLCESVTEREIQPSDEEVKALNGMMGRLLRNVDYGTFWLERFVRDGVHTIDSHWTAVRACECNAFDFLRGVMDDLNWVRAPDQEQLFEGLLNISLAMVEKPAHEQFLCDALDWIETTGRWGTLSASWKSPGSPDAPLGNASVADKIFFSGYLKLAHHFLAKGYDLDSVNGSGENALQALCELRDMDGNEEFDPAKVMLRGGASVADMSNLMRSWHASCEARRAIDELGLDVDVKAFARASP